jgi:hypothetical protein
VRSSLPAGERGRLLKRVATDPTLGAPVREQRALRTRPAVVADRPGALGAIGGALFGSSALWPILLLMAISAVVAVASARVRRRP